MAALLRLQPPANDEVREKIALTLGDLAAALISQERYSEAENILHEALDIVKLLEPARRRQMPILWGNLGSIHELIGEWDRAEADFAEALRSAKKYLGEDAPYLAVLHAWVIPTAPPPPKPMDPNADPKFEVATIKPSRPGAPGKAFRVQGRQFSTLNTTLADLITFAYGIHPKQITSGSSWMESEKFDLLGQPEGEGQPNGKQWQTMIQKLLADRFELRFHRDKKELTVYAIVVDKNGHKLVKSAGDPNGLPALFFRGLGNLPARNATMADFAGLMQSAVLDRPVIDQTTLSGRFDFTLVWTPDEFQFGGGGGRGAPPQINGQAAPDLFGAFKEQLGLRLESTKAPSEVLVIDAVEKPTPN